MTFDDYQNEAKFTDRYPLDFRLECLAMGLCSEAGEVAGKVKKYHRDGPLHPEEIASELGDVLWYVATMADYFNIDLEDIAKGNVVKLRDRYARNAIGGSGDAR